MGDGVLAPGMADDGKARELRGMNSEDVELRAKSANIDRHDVVLAGRVGLGTEAMRSTEGPCRRTAASCCGILGIVEDDDGDDEGGGGRCKRCDETCCHSRHEGPD